MDDVDAFLRDAETSEMSPRELLGSYFDVLFPHRDVLMTLLRDASPLAYVDLEAASVRWVERFQELLVGADASPAERVRAMVAVGGLGRCLLVTGIAVDQLRAAAVDAACAALHPETAGATP